MRANNAAAVLFALLTALANGSASVLQRRAAATAPAASALHPSLISYLIRNKVWLAGIGMQTLAAVLQAAALYAGPVALVQPIFIFELPFTLLLASRVFKYRLAGQCWGAIALVTVSLGAGLAAAAPSGASATAPLGIWLRALVATACFEAVVITAGVRTRGNSRAAAFGLAAACGYSLTAALLKGAMAALARGVVPFLTSWELYGAVAAGLGAMFLVQNAFQAGSLIAAQPPLTLGDALISVAYGVTIFGEKLRTGPWLAAEIAAVLLIALGIVELSRSLAAAHASAS